MLIILWQLHPSFKDILYSSSLEQEPNAMVITNQPMNMKKKKKNKMASCRNERRFDDRIECLN